MKRLISSHWWATHLPITIVYVCVCAVFVFTVNSVSNLREEDASQAYQTAVSNRDASVRFCEGGNERTAVLREFLLSAVQEPDPRQFDFIADPVLRAGALDQSRRSRSELRDRIEHTFTPRNCHAEFPPLPPRTDR